MWYKEKSQRNSKQTTTSELEIYDYKTELIWGWSDMDKQEEKQAYLNWRKRREVVMWWWNNVCM